MNAKLIQVRRPVAAAALGLCLILGAAAAWVMEASGTVHGAGGSVAVTVAKDNDSGAERVSFTDGFAPVVQPVLPAVVNIHASKIVKMPQQQMPFLNDPMFQQFFGQQFGQQYQQPQQQREHSLGSGVIVSSDGYILTNNHVVDGASDIKVSLKDKREFKAQVVGTDPRTDLAVLKIPATGLTAITFGDSAKAQVGDFVLAIGNPFGVGETVTMGIISALQRSGLGIEDYEDFIQTDAAINPGNSGGALINVHGDLIGINTAILTGGEGGGNEGVGFAIPVNMARGIMEQLVKNGKVSRGYIGVGIEAVTPDLAKAFGLATPEGALVGEVEPNSPGSRAGLQRGDIILSVDGQPISDERDLRLRIAAMAPGLTVKLEIVRNGQKQTVSVTLAEFPDKTASASEGQPSSNALEGVQVDELTPQIAREIGLPPGTTGVVISDVDESSSAAEAGLQRGDVIQEVNRQPVNNLEQYEKAIRAAGNGEVLLLVNRGGATRYVAISGQ
ncbi:MAG TPA: DegQ family serine endoprotease [Methylomirabilota bacterium]|nr:DegQ family serine endoprotease [Methylomirabilota bacterium]